MATPSDILREAISRQHESVSAIAKRAGLPRHSVQAVVDGHVPSVNRAAEICNALKMEFHIDPPRGGAVAPPVAASETELQAGTDDLSLEIAAYIKATWNDPTRLEATLRRKPVVNLNDAGALVGAVNDDDDPPSGARYVGLTEAAVAAGGGALIEGAPVKGKAWFRRDWVDSHALNPARCFVIGVRGESMEPVLLDGASILVDRERTRRRAGHIHGSVPAPT